MAKYDVHLLRAGRHPVLDCQADLLDDLNTRLVVPLLPIDEAPKPAFRLNPILDVKGASLVMMTQFAASVPVAVLGETVQSLKAQQDAVNAALDMLIVGF